MKNDWGWNGSDSNWDTWIIVKATPNEGPNNLNYPENDKLFYFKLTIELRACSSNEEAWKILRNKWGYEDETSEFNQKVEFPTVNGFYDWLKSFAKDVGQGIMYLLIKLLRLLIDIVQIICNIIQMNRFDLMYSPSTLQYDATTEAPDRDIYTKIGNPGSIKENQYKINIDAETYKYMSSPEIPIIAGDMYYVATNKVSFLDINFLTGEKDHKNDTLWIIIKNFAVSVIHICLYISVAFIIIALIIHSIIIVLHSVDSPEKEVTLKKGLEKFAISIVQLVSTIIIISLCIFANKMLVSILGFDNGLEGPIRVDVPSAGYSFSTTTTGYIRYMTQIDGLANWTVMGKYTLVYLILTLVNIVNVVFMLGRMIIMWMLAMIGPIIAALNAINIYKPMRYGTWVELYVKLTLIQSFMIIGYKIILESAI